MKAVTPIVHFILIFLIIMNLTVTLLQQYVHKIAENIKKTAHWEVDVDVDLFHSETGVNQLSEGLFKGKTMLYSDLKHVVLRIVPKYLPEARENTILVSSHIDTVFSGYIFVSPFFFVY